MYRIRVPYPVTGVFFSLIITKPSIMERKKKFLRQVKNFHLLDRTKTPPDYFTEFIGLEISKHSIHLRDTPNQLCSNSRKNKLIPDWFSPLLLVSKPQRLKLKKKLQKKLKKQKSHKNFEDWKRRYS